MSKIQNSRICYGSYYSYLKNYPNVDIKEADCRITKFSDGEISVRFLESLRGKHLFVFGETTHNLTELLLIIDAAKRSSVGEITVVMPYYGYSRQDKREGSRGCLGASLIAQVLQGLGINRVITIDLHAEQIMGYFHGLPVEHISGRNIFMPDVEQFTTMLQYNFGFVLEKTKFAAPDAGANVRTRRFADAANLPFVTADKRRAAPGVVESMQLYGDVDGCDIVIIDDIADSCGTLRKNVDLLKSKGARKVIALVTHPVFSGAASKNINDSQLDAFFFSDTLQSEIIIDREPFTFKQFSCMSVLNLAINAVARGESLSHLTGY